MQGLLNKELCNQIPDLVDLYTGFLSKVIAYLYTGEDAEMVSLTGVPFWISFSNHLYTQITEDYTVRENLSRKSK